jgi:hypothetical protein
MKALRGKSVVIATCAAMLLLLILYVLSSGPAQVLVKRGYLSEDVYYVVYAPVVFAFRNSPACHDFLLWHDAKWREWCLGK